MSEIIPKDPLDFVQEKVLEHVNFKGTDRELHDLVEAFKTLSGSMVVIFNEVSSGEEFTTTRVIAGLENKWVRASEILGFPLLNTSYNLDPAIKEAFNRAGLIEYASLYELSMHQIPESICKLISRSLDVGNVFVLGLRADELLLGDLIFIQKKGTEILHPDIVEIFGGHMALFLLQYRRSTSDFFDVLIDRTRSEQTGQALIQSFYRATEKIPDLVYQLDTEGSFVFINHAIERYGYFREELIGHSILEIVHPDDRERTHWNLAERRSGDRKTVDVEVRFITGKNKTVFFSVTEKDPPQDAVVRLYSEGMYDKTPGDRRFLGTLGICRDITVERDLEIKLNNQVEVFRIIAEHTDEGIWLEQAHPPRILYSNPAAQDMVAPVRKTVEKNATSYIDLVHPDDLARVRDYAGILDSLDTPSEIEFRMFGKDKTPRWVQLRFFPVYYNGGITNKRVGLALDITDRKLYQADLLGRIEKGEAYMKELNHRVKNNLAMIESMISLEISALPVDEERTGMLLSSVRGRIQSVGLVHQMLYDMSRGGMIEISEYLRILVTAIVESGTDSSCRPDLEFDLTGQYWMSAEDVIPVGMIANELVTNALKHAFPGKKGGILKLCFREETEGRFLLDITDNGIDYRAETGRTSSSGIGMVLVETLVEQLNGRYEVISGNGEKSFRVRFPSKEVK